RLRDLARPLEAERAESHRRSRSRDRIACRSRFREDLESALVRGFVVRVSEFWRVRKRPLVVLRESGGGPLGEGACGWGGAAAGEDSAARRGEVLRCAAGEAGELGGLRVELSAVAVRLLEVVAENLIALDELLAVQPVRELLVQLCPRRLGQGLVRGI